MCKCVLVSDVEGAVGCYRRSSAGENGTLGVRIKAGVLNRPWPCRKYRHKRDANVHLDTNRRGNEDCAKRGQRDGGGGSYGAEVGVVEGGGGGGRRWSYWWWWCWRCGDGDHSGVDGGGDIVVAIVVLMLVIVVVIMVVIMVVLMVVLGIV